MSLDSPHHHTKYLLPPKTSNLQRFYKSSIEVFVLTNSLSSASFTGDNQNVLIYPLAHQISHLFASLRILFWWKYPINWEFSCLIHVIHYYVGKWWWYFSWDLEVIAAFLIQLCVFLIWTGNFQLDFRFRHQPHPEQIIISICLVSFLSGCMFSFSRIAEDA